jgi:hypothetical protein
MDMIKEVFHPLLEVKTDCLATAHHSVYDSGILGGIMVIDDYEIKSYCKPLGRPPKEGQSEENIRNMAKASGDRNEIESTFGVGKRIYRANNIRAKLPDTARCWTGMCYFIKNLMKFLRELCLVLLEIVTILKLYGLGVRPCGLPRQRALLIIQ